MRKVVALFVILSLGTPFFAMAQQAMSSATYKIESDSLNSGGTRSTSGSYGVEDTAGEVSTGRSHSSNFGLFEAGYQGMRTDIAAPTNVAPTTPTNVAAAVVSSSAIDLTWDASTDDYAVAGYYIYRDGVKVASLAQFPREYLDTGLNAVTAYAYTVSAFDEDGNESVLSAEVSATTLAAPINNSIPSGHTLIGNFAITPDANSAIVSFTTQTSVVAMVSWGSDGAYSAGSISDAAPTLTHSLLVSSLAPGQRYFVKLTLADQNGGINFENISFVTLRVSNTLPPPDVTHFVAKGSEKAIALTWTNPSDPKMTGVKILRSEIFYPGEPTDGTVIFSGRADHFTDTTTVSGKTYYYTAFSTDQAGNFSSGSLASAKLVAVGQPSVPTKPLEQVSQASHINPIVNALTLKDFLFIQNGDSVPVTNMLSLDGSTNTTVALKYYRVPEVLKTIAVTLSTTGENPEYFTFVLKANRDKTRYEATIGPLGDVRDYNVRITVLDFQNQSLKTIDGTAHVIKAPVVARAALLSPATHPIAARTTSLVLLVLLGLVLGLFFLLKGKLLRPAVAATGALIVLLAVSPLFAQAAINPQVNYQGRLVDGSNVAVTNGSYNMRFNLYTVSSGGSSIWTETRTVADKVAVTSGLFSVMLGSVNSLSGVNFNQPLYLGVEIGGTAVSPTWDGEMTPRKIIGAVPAALVADTLDGLDSTQFVRSDADTTINANLTVNGTLAVTTGTGNWTGTIAGQAASFYLSRANHTGTQLASTITGATFGSGSFIFPSGSLTALGSTTLQNFTFANATGTNATTTTLAVTTLCLTGDSCRTTWPTGGGGSSASTTLFADNNAFTGLNTFTDLKLVTRSTTTNATTTNLAVSGTLTLGGTNVQTTLNGLVPYTGATSNVDLGSNDLTLGGMLTASNDINLTSGARINLNGGIIAVDNAAAYSFLGNTFNGILDFSGVNASDKTFTFQNTSGTVGLLEATQAWTGANIFNNITRSTTTAATTTSLAISSIASKILKTNANGSIIPAIAGTDYLASTNGDWTGTFDGQEGVYYLANSFSTTSANTFLATKTTDNLTEGVTNQYFTQTHFDTALEATTTLNNLAVLKGITDFIAARGTTTNATSTSFFATTASSTNLFATNGTIGAPDLQ
jgi:protein-S-isoprenylcysteine O-methyltransferase Ste14